MPVCMAIMAAVDWLFIPDIVIGSYRFYLV